MLYALIIIAAIMILNPVSILGVLWVVSEILVAFDRFINFITGQTRRVAQQREEQSRLYKEQCQLLASSRQAHN